MSIETPSVTEPRLTVRPSQPRTEPGPTAPSGLRAEPLPASLDALLALDADTLERLYVGASVPRLEDVRGDLRGRMLAIPAFGSGLVASLVRSFAGSDRFPWRGKSFSPHSSERGEGINRVFTDRLRLYRFETFVGPSRAGAFDAVQLDYDLAENPFFIRAIKDEIRELSPGLYLGQAWLAIGERRPVLGLYFALERPASSIGAAPLGPR